MKIGGHWSVFHVNQISDQLRQKALDDAANGTSEVSRSHAKGQGIAVGVVLAVAVLLLILLKLA